MTGMARKVGHHLRRQPRRRGGLLAVRLEDGAAHAAEARVQRRVDDVHVPLALVRLLVMMQVDHPGQHVLGLLRPASASSLRVEAASRQRQRRDGDDAARARISATDSLDTMLMDAPDAAEYTRVSSDPRRPDMLRRQAAIALLVLCTAGVAHTQQAAREQKPVKEHTFDLETSYIRMPLPPGDEKYGRLDGYRMKEHVRAITAITRKYHESGERYWGRLPGSQADVDTEAIHRRAVPRIRTGGRDAARQPVAAVARHRLELHGDRQRHDADADVHLSGGRHVQHAGRGRHPRDRLGRPGHRARLRRPRRQGQAGVPAQRPAAQRVPGDGAFERRDAARGAEGRRRRARQRQHSRQRHPDVRLGAEGADVLDRHQRRRGS